MMTSQTSMRFENLDALPNVFSVNISNHLFDQTPLSRISKLFLHVDVVTRVWGKGVMWGTGKNFTYSK